MRLNTSALESHFAATGNDFGGILATDNDLLALEFPTCNDFDGFQKETKDMLNNKKGTTTLSFIFDKGVIVAADSRASMGGYICENAVSSLGSVQNLVPLSIDYVREDTFAIINTLINCSLLCPEL